MAAWPKLAAYGGFNQPPQTLAAHSAGPLEAKKAFRAAKVGPRLCNSSSVRDALIIERNRMKMGIAPERENLVGGQETIATD
jgi:hypothetical protein